MTAIYSATVGFVSTLMAWGFNAEPSKPFHALTIGPNVVVVRAGERRIVMTKTSLRRFLTNAGGSEPDDSVLRHCAQPIAALIHADADLTAHVFRRPKPTLVHVSRFGRMQ